MKIRGSTIPCLFLLGLSLFFLVRSFSYRGMAEFVPLAFAIPTVLLTLTVLFGERFPRILPYFEVGLETLLTTAVAEETSPSASHARTEEARLVVQTFGWFVAFTVILFLLGFYVATALFAPLFMRFQGKISWSPALIVTLVSEVFFYVVFEEILAVNLFKGIIFGASVPPL